MGDISKYRQAPEVYAKVRADIEAENARLRADGHVFYDCGADEEREPTKAELAEVLAANEARMRERFPFPRVGELSGKQRAAAAAKALDRMLEADGVAFEPYKD